MGCYGTSNKKPNQTNEGNSSDFAVLMKYTIDAMTGLVITGVATVAIYYAACTPHEVPKPDHTPVEVLDDIKEK